MRNVDKKLVLIADAETRTTVRQDIVNLQLAKSRPEFEYAKLLLLKKYNLNPSVTAFMQYFKNEWLETRDGWFEGEAEGMPSTNNGLESTNNRIKEDGTLRARLSMSEFMQFMFTQSCKWSEERIPDSVNCKCFIDVPTATLSLQVIH